MEKETRIIRKIFTEKPIIYTDEGGDNSVVFIDDLVFRFPKDEEISDLYKQEVRVLTGIRSRISTQIPEMKVDIYTTSSDDKVEESIYTVHTKIEGVTYKSLPQEKKDEFLEKVSEGVANFLVELHSIGNEFDLYNKNPATTSDYLLGIKDLREMLIDYLSKNEKYLELLEDLNRTIEKVDSYKDSGIHVIAHYDLHEGNIIVNPNTGELSGIIDFDTVSYRDFNEEFYSICKRPESRFGMAVKKKYEKKTGRTVDLEYILNLRKLNLYDKILDRIQKSHNQEISKEDSKDIEGYVDKIKHIRDIAPSVLGL